MEKNNENTINSSIGVGLGAYISRTKVYGNGCFGLNVQTVSANNYIVRVDNIYLALKPPLQGTVIILE